MWHVDLDFLKRVLCSLQSTTWTIMNHEAMAVLQSRNGTTTSVILFEKLPNMSNTDVSLIKRLMMRCNMRLFPLHWVNRGWCDSVVTENLERSFYMAIGWKQYMYSLQYATWRSISWSKSSRQRSTVPQIPSFLQPRILGIGDTFAHISHTFEYPKYLKGQVMYGGWGFISHLITLVG